MLERREVVPIGANRPVPIDVRVITATNSGAEAGREQAFRQDLLYRLNTVELILPPLRERREDIPVLADHFIAIYARKYNSPRRRLSSEALARCSKPITGRATCASCATRRARDHPRRPAIGLEPQDFPAAHGAPIPAAPRRSTPQSRRDRAADDPAGARRP